MIAFLRQDVFYIPDNTICFSGVTVCIEDAIPIFIINHLFVTRLKFFSILEKVTDKNDFIIRHFQNGGTFIPVGLIFAAAAFVRPVYGGFAAFTDRPLNLEGQLGILTKENIQKLQIWNYPQQIKLVDEELFVDPQR